MRQSRWVRVAACWSWLLVAGLATMAPVARAQFRGVRFEITQVGDTTFGFSRGDANWVRQGMTGIAVDPTRRDVLVARFRVIKVDTGFVTALVTGQTTRVSTEHVVVMSEPPRPWYKVPLFWGGTALGLVIGVLAGKG
jgi:hypothetical protein